MMATPLLIINSRQAHHCRDTRSQSAQAIKFPMSMLLELDIATTLMTLSCVNMSWLNHQAEKPKL